MDKLAVPTVHLNGTGKAELLRQLSDAGKAVRQAMEALQQAAPHGRDYYVQDPSGAVYGEPIKAASEQHASRLQRLDSVYRELVEVALAIQDQSR